MQLIKFKVRTVQRQTTNEKQERKFAITHPGDSESDSAPALNTHHYVEGCFLWSQKAPNKTLSLKLPQSENTWVEFRVYYLKMKNVKLVGGKAVGVCSENLLMSVGKVQLTVSSSGCVYTGVHHKQARLPS